MALGPAHPVWRALYDALAALAVECRSPFAFVLDEGNGLWCVGIRGEAPTTLTFEQNEAADRFYRDEIVPRMKMMRRGQKFEVVRRFTDVNKSTDRYFAVSFAGIYALVVWFDDAFEVEWVRACVRKALPRPFSGERASKARA